MSHWIVSGLMTIVCAALGWRLLGLGSNMGWLFAALAVACAAAGTLGRNSVIPCLALGLAIGFVLDQRIGGGTAESQMWETVESLVGGAVVGLVVGVAMDVYTRRLSA